MNTLHFGDGNIKLKHGQRIFDLPAGHSCPFALKCHSFANRITGHIADGKHAEFRCYAASIESLRSRVRELRWQNFDIIKGLRTTSLIYAKLKKDLPFSFIYRLHSSGDFFSQAYFDAWLKIAELYPKRIFYAYTKALPFWVKRLENIPANLILTASYGGKYDGLIEQFKLKNCRVVNTVEEAQALGLEIDHDDTHAWKTHYDFAILIHGMGPKGSFQAKAHSAKARMRM